MATSRSVSGKWWIPVLLVAIALPVNLVGGSVIGLGVVVAGWDGGTATHALWLLVLLTLLGSPIAVHYDRKYVSAISDWTPTRLYYLTFLGYVGMVIAAIYLWRRRAALGNA